MKISNPFKGMSLFEYILWIGSMIAIIIAFIIPEEKEYLNLVTSLVGVTCVFFIAKGKIFGQIVGIIYAIVYGFISYFHNLYGEVFLSFVFYAPLAILGLVEWAKNQYADTHVVTITKLTKIDYFIALAITIVLTTIAFFVLSALNTQSLVVSTISIATSTMAGYFVIKRSPGYALFYFLNDSVLIVMWSIEAYQNISALPMVISFITFVINDLYGFINWLRLRKKQTENSI